MTDAYKQGYEDYYNGAYRDECPYSYNTELDFWNDWNDGHNYAYCEAEGK